MAGGRKKKASKINRTKRNSQQRKPTTKGETKDTASTTTKVDSEKDKPIKTGHENGHDQASKESSSSSIESKYVPPFSRNSKKLNKNDEGNIGKSQSKTSQRLKRRLDENEDEVSSGKSNTNLCLKSVNSNIDDFASCRNSINKDNGLIHLNKQPKLSPNVHQEENTKSIEEFKGESTVSTEENQCSSVSKDSTNQDGGEGFKEIAIIHEFIEEVKLTGRNGEECNVIESGDFEATTVSNMSEATGDTPDHTEKMCTGEADSPSDRLSPIDELVKACFMDLVERVEDVINSG